MRRSKFTNEFGRLITIRVRREGYVIHWAFQWQFISAHRGDLFRVGQDHLKQFHRWVSSIVRWFLLWPEFLRHSNQQWSRRYVYPCTNIRTVHDLDRFASFQDLPEPHMDQYHRNHRSSKGENHPVPSQCFRSILTFKLAICLNLNGLETALCLRMRSFIASM